jgi:hypothetical protein
MARTVVVDMQTLPVGHTTFPTFSIGGAVSKGLIAIDRTQWIDATSTLSFNFELSQDNGATWLPGGGGTAVGGTVLDKNGVVAVETSITVSLPGAGSGNRKIRGYFDVTGIVTIAASVEFT